MRSLHMDKVNSLKRLTELREAMMTSELAVKRAAVSQKETEIQELNSRTLSSGSPWEQAAYALWQRWREQELCRLNTEQAVLRTNYERCMRAVGRAVAENSIVDHLKDVSQVTSKSQTRRQQEHAQASHLLTHDIGDKDI